MLTGEELDQHFKTLTRSRDSEKDSVVAAAHKTVDTFSGIMKRKLWLKNGVEAYTDGHEIVVPYQNSHFYQLVEHEIAHNLFQSNFAAKQEFMVEYTGQIVKAVESSGRTVSGQDKAVLAECLGFIANVIEDHRVNSLWAMLYPGSYDRLHRYSKDTLSAKATRANAQDNISTYFLLTAYDVENMPAGRLDRFKPAMVAVLKKIERKGPAATFVLSKWLVTQLISELIREVKGEPPADHSNATARVDVTLGAAGASQDQQISPPPQGSESGDSAQAEGTGPSKQEWQPPAVDATPQERINALEGLLALAKPQAQESVQEARVKRILSDVHESRFKKGDKEAVAAAKQALQTNVNDSASLDLLLARSEQQMEAVVASIEEALQAERERNADGWITRDIKAKIAFEDITAKDVPASVVAPMSSEDRAAAARLKHLFSRIEHRRRTALYDSGNEVDIEAYVSSRVNQTAGAMFKEEGAGRGFKVLILLDRSSSMRGSPSKQVERATRILRSALKVPNVSFNVWGFSGMAGEVKIGRISSGVDVADCAALPVLGETPLHIALRAGINWMREGDEKKHIIVLTDGEPVFSTKVGAMRESAMIEMIRKDCEKARRGNLSITAIGIGRGVSTAALGQMFGDKRHWTSVPSSDQLVPTLVGAVSKSFSQFIRSR